MTIRTSVHTSTDANDNKNNNKSVDDGAKEVVGVKAKIQNGTPLREPMTH